MKKTYNPLALWGFWIGGLLGGLTARLIFGKGKLWLIFQRCVEEACINMNISSYTFYGAIIGLILGYLLHITLRRKK